MLKKTNRLCRSEDFRRVYGYKFSRANRHMVIFWYPNGLTESRFGFSLSKKIGKAHVRNSYKRRLRELTRLHLNEIHPGFDVVVLCRRPIVETDYKELESSYMALLERCGLCDQSL